MNLLAGIKIILYCALAPAILFAGNSIKAQTTEKYTIYKLENKIGEEQCTYRVTPAGNAYTINIQANDRGTPLKLQATLNFTANKVTYTSVGLTSRFKAEKIDTAVVPAAGFAISNNGSIKLKELLVMYWLKAGRPVSIKSAVTGQPIQITVLGTDKDMVKDEELSVLKVEGLNSTSELLWTNSQGKVLFMVGYDTEADRREVISNTYLQLFTQFNAQSNRYMLSSYTHDTQNMGKRYENMAITGANLIDVVNGKTISDALVVIENGKITYAGKAEPARITAGMQIIDAKGKYLLPGLWDMHAHLFHAGYLKTELLSGVTTVRDMANEFDWVSRLKKAAALSSIPSPTILTAGIVDGRGPATLGTVTATSAKEISEAVKKYHDAGFEQIKVYSSFKPGNLGKLVQEAKQYNMDVVGHVPVGITAASGIAAGMKSISHIHYFMNALKWKNGTFTIEDNKKLLDNMKAQGVVLDPTLNVYALTGDTKLSTYKRLLKFFYEQGIPIVAGTDNEGTIANELKLYTEAGLTPLQAIRAATIAPARFMKMDAQTGSIDAGKNAEIIMVNENPLLNINTLNTVDTIIKGNVLIYKGAAK